MEDMDVDQVLEVPDTPDRLASQNINGKICVRRESHVSSMANLFEYADISDDGSKGGLRNKNKRATKRETSMFIPPRNSSNKFELQGNIRKIATETAPFSMSAFNSKKNVVDDAFNNGGKNNIQPEYMGKGKAISSSHSQMPACQGHVPVVHLTEHDAHSNVCQKVIAGSSQDKQHKKEILDKSFSPLLIAEDSDIGVKIENPRTSHRNSCQKILVKNKFIPALDVTNAKQPAQKQNNTFPHSHQDDSGTSRESTTVNKDSGRVKEILEKSFSPILIAEDSDVGGKLEKPRNSHRSSCQKRLVRNGCISPHNVLKAKQSVQKQNNTFPHARLDDSGTSRESTAEDKDSRRVKGKGLLTDNILSKESDAKTKPLSGRTLAGKVDGANPANEDACERPERAHGWISTHEHTRKLNPPFSDEEHLSRMTDDPCNVNKLPRNVVVRRDKKDGSNAQKHSVSSQTLSVAPTVQTVSQKHQGCRLNEHRGSLNTVIKRQRQGSSGSHHGESSSSAIGNSELVGIGSSGEPLNVRSVRTQSSHTARSFNQIIDIDEFSPETRSNGSYNIDRSSSNESDVRAIQLEADEILARELQEQLYNESNVTADRERSSSILHRQNLSRSSQNSSSRRVTQARVPTSTRMARLRGRFPGQPRTISSRQRNSQFPPNMDVDMRMHVLEALEAFNNMGMAGGFLQTQRDFNENDYEMLLALDENNHQHGGASVTQINGLPESTVQTGNLEECSICLETPNIGDTIRHLPCLHRFHKDCIDEWLRRKTSCPVCKSSIT